MCRHPHPRHGGGARGLFCASSRRLYVWHHGYNRQGSGQRSYASWLQKYCLATTLLPVAILLLGMQPDLQLMFMKYFAWGWTPPQADPSIIKDILRGKEPKVSSEESYERENAIRRRMYAENPGAAADPDAAYFKSEGVAKKVKWMPSLD
eukprot:g3845.t1